MGSGCRETTAAVFLPSGRRPADDHGRAMGAVVPPAVDGDTGDRRAIRTCAIVTTSAGPDMESIHDRMSVILEATALDPWLDPDNQIRMSWRRWCGLPDGDVHHPPVDLGSETSATAARSWWRPFPADVLDPVSRRSPRPMARFDRGRFQSRLVHVLSETDQEIPMSEQTSISPDLFVVGPRQPDAAAAGTFYRGIVRLERQTDPARGRWLRHVHPPGQERGRARPADESRRAAVLVGVRDRRRRRCRAGLGGGQWVPVWRRARWTCSTPVGWG